MATLGEILKKERTKKKITLDEIFLKTRISRKIVSALEEDKADSSLSPVYSKYFLRTYAKFLGLNPDELLKMHQQPPLKSNEAVFKEGELKFKSPQIANFDKIFLRTVLVVFLLAAFYLLFFSFKKVTHKIISKRNTSSYKKEAKSNVPLEAKKKAVLSESTRALSIPKNEEIALLIKTKDETWLKVTTDGKVMFEGTLRRGLNETWRAKEKLELKIGKPEAIELSVNSEAILSPKLGQNILITRDSLKINPK